MKGGAPRKRESQSVRTQYSEAHLWQLHAVAMDKRTRGTRSRSFKKLKDGEATRAKRGRPLERMKLTGV